MEAHQATVSSDIVMAQLLRAIMCESIFTCSLWKRDRVKVPEMSLHPILGVGLLFASLVWANKRRTVACFVTDMTFHVVNVVAVPSDLLKDALRITVWASARRSEYTIHDDWTVDPVRMLQMVHYMPIPLAVTQEPPRAFYTESCSCRNGGVGIYKMIFKEMIVKLGMVINCAIALVPVTDELGSDMITEMCSSHFRVRGEAKQAMVPLTSPLLLLHRDRKLLRGLMGLVFLRTSQQMRLHGKPGEVSNGLKNDT
jgi:hypothetical protein